MKVKQIIPLAALTFYMPSFCHAQAMPIPVAEYRFTNSFASSTPGAPDLIAVDPLGQSGFGSDTVFGNTQQVYNFNGVANPAASQAGLSLDTTGLLSSHSTYAIEIIFKFTDENLPRRILDFQDRQGDGGVYLEANNSIIIRNSGGGGTFDFNVYHDLLIQNNGGANIIYVDGIQRVAFGPSHLIDIGSSNRINFFLDNVVGENQGEYSSGSVALVRLYNTAAVPEPETYAMFLAGLGLLGWRLRNTRN